MTIYSVVVVVIVYMVDSATIAWMAVRTQI